MMSETDLMSIEHYNANRGIYSPLIQTDSGMACGFWIVGNDYHNKSKLYGAYPPSYLKRISLLFSHPKKILHLFSGMVETGTWGPGVREDLFDCQKYEGQESKNGDVFIGDAVHLIEEIARQAIIEDEFLAYDLIVADPPYDENHVKYGVPKVNKKKAIKECSYLIRRGGYLVWLDTITPIWAKADGWKQMGAIGLQQSTNHKVRVVTILKKVA